MLQMQLCSFHLGSIYQLKRNRRVCNGGAYMYSLWPGCCFFPVEVERFLDESTIFSRETEVSQCSGSLLCDLRSEYSWVNKILISFKTKNIPKAVVCFVKLRGLFVLFKSWGNVEEKLGTSVKWQKVEISTAEQWCQDTALMFVL